MKVSKIVVATPPTKTAYIAGDQFDPSGMVIKATYSIGNVVVADNVEVTGYQCSPTTLTDGVTAIKITYSEGGTTVETTTPITVTHRVVSMSVTTNPTKTTYKYLETFDFSAARVTVIYSDNATSVKSISTSGNPKYGPPTTANAMGNINVPITYTENGHTVNCTLPITVIKADSSITLNKTAVTVMGADGSAVVNVTKGNSYTGAISATSNSTYCRVAVSGNKITITNDGNSSHTGTFTVTVSGESTATHNAPANKTISVTIAYWEWGSETATSGDIGNAQWWAGLKSWVLTATASELASCVGKTKYVVLSSAVRSVTGHLVRCIGYNRDGNQTLTFQTDTCFLDSNTANNYFCTDSEYSTFGSNALWTNGTNDSQARKQCKAYYNAFPGKASIKTVQKRYLSTQSNSNSMHNTACDKTYSETVFLPSENEMGWKGTGSASSSVGYGKANNEVCPDNTGVEPYQYYTDNSKRIKKAQGTNSNAGSNWRYWERSRCYNSDYPNGVCRVGSDGTASYSGYDGGDGLAPAFVIG